MRRKQPSKLASRRIQKFVAYFSALGIVVILTYSAILWLAPVGEIKWIRSEKIRAAYFAASDNQTYLEYQMTQLKRSGLNTAVLSFGTIDPSSPQTEIIFKASKLAHERGLHLFVSYHFFGGEVGEPKAVNEVGEETTVHCPLDESYWEYHLEKAVLALSGISESYGIEGIVFDTELYGGKPFQESYDHKVCFDDHCFNMFLKETERRGQGSVEKSQRKNWLKQKGLLQEYYTFLRDQIRRKSRSLARKARRSSPNLLFGFLAGVRTWFDQGLALGLGSTKRPVILLDEATYVGGARTRLIPGEVETLSEYDLAIWERPGEPTELTVEHVLRRIGEVRARAIYVPGIWISHFYSFDLAAHLYRLAERADGYWIYSTTFIQPNRMLSDPNRPPMPAREYWDAIREANSEIDRLLKNTEHTTKLSWRSDVPQVKEFMSIAESSRGAVAAISDSPSDTEVTLQGFNTILDLSADPEFEIEVFQGEEEAVVLVGIPDGVVIGLEEIDPGQKRSIQGEPGRSLIALINCTSPYKIFSNQKISVIQPITVAKDCNLYLRLRSNASSLDLVALGEGRSQATLVLLDEGGKVLLSRPASDVTLHLDIPPSFGDRILHLEIRKVSDPLTLSIGGGVLPYLAFRPGGLPQKG